MNRLKDYIGFAVSFIGLGYVVLWPVSTPGNGALFGARFLCKGGRVLDLVCHMPHPLRLGAGLHVFGVLCAVLAALQLAVRAAGRMRRRRRGAAEVVAASPAPAPETAKPRARPRRQMPPPRKLERARSHFGLRGLTQ